MRKDSDLFKKEIEKSKEDWKKEIIDEEFNRGQIQGIAATGLLVAFAFFGFFIVGGLLFLFFIPIQLTTNQAVIINVCLIFFILVLYEIRKKFYKITE